MPDNMYTMRAGLFLAGAILPPLCRFMRGGTQMIKQLVTGGLLGVVSMWSAHAQCAPGGPKTIPGTIVGLVTDDKNQPLEGISIVIAQPKRQARTNARGEFRIDNVPAGDVPVLVRR